jgi:hypothetical protein
MELYVVSEGLEFFYLSMLLGIIIKISIQKLLYM